MKPHEPMSTPSQSLSAETLARLKASYPSNHGYRVYGKLVVPNFNLYKRWRKISALCPDSPASFVDLSASKGYFVIKASRAGIPRVTGMDVDSSILEPAVEVISYLGLEGVDLFAGALEEFADHLQTNSLEPYEAAILINTYQYLYFGSRASSVVRTHEQIFQQLRRICAGTLIFSNCVEVEQLPRGMRQRSAADRPRLDAYNGDAIREAADPYFVIEEFGYLRKRPLWRLTAK